MDNIIRFDLRNKTWKDQCPEELKISLEKIKKIQIEKDLVVKNGHYDFAANLRDMELKVWEQLYSVLGATDLEKYLI